MKQLEVIRVLEKAKKSLFSLADLKKLLYLKDKTVYIQLNRLTKSGLLIRMKRDVYCLGSRKIDNFEIANFLYKPSYISLESALAYYGILLQVPQTIISVTPRRTKRFIIDGKEFIYLHLDQRYYFGYEQNDKFLVADKEKAIIDTIFFASFGRILINPEEWIFKDVSHVRLKQLASKIKSPIFHNLLRKITK